MYFSKLSRFEVLIRVQKKKICKYLAGRRSQASFIRLNPGGQ